MKTFYIGPIRRMLNSATVLLSKFDKDSSTQSVDGTSFTVPIHYGRNVNAGKGVGEGNALPTAGNQSYQKAVIPNKYIYAPIEISGPVMKATKTNAGAFIRALDSELKGAMNDMKRAVNRQMHGDGKDALAMWTSADNSSGTVVDDGNGYAFSHLPSGVAITCDLIATSDNSTKRGDSIVVTQTTEDTTTPGWNVTWTGTVSGSADGDYLTLEDSLGYQMMGIAGLIDNTDPVVPAGGGTLTGLHGLAVGTYPWWISQIVGSDSSKADLSFANMQKVLSKIAANSDYEEKDVKLLVCSYNVRDKYYELAVNERRFVNTMTLDGGFEGLEFNGKPLVPDSQCKHGRIYFITPETIKIFRTADFDWMEEDGAILHRKQGYDVYQASLFHYGDLGIVARNANGVLKGINE
jgi:hypothetical protein